MWTRLFLFEIFFTFCEIIFANDVASICKSHNKSSETCSCIIEGNKLICCSPAGISTHRICPSQQSTSNITQIFIQGESPDFVNLTDDFVERLGLGHQKIERLIVENTGVEYVNICKKGSHWCSNLQLIDLRNNNISRLEEPKLGNKNGFSLFLSGNPWPFAFPGKGGNTRIRGKSFLGDIRTRKEVEWSYSDNKYSVDLMWLLESKWNQNWKDMKTTWCPHVEGFRKSQERQPLIEMLNIVKKTFLDCPVSCICNTNILHNKDVDIDGLEFPIQTLCVGLNLTSLPNKIPIKTDHLDVSDNQIENLDRLKNYKNLRYLIMKRNKVTSVKGLLDTPLIMEDPQEIDLSQNKITSLIILGESMSNLLKSKRHPVFSFSSNPLVCTCGCIKKTQQFIFKYANNLLLDHFQMKCSDTQSTDVDMRGRLISDIEEEECGEPFDFLLIVIALEVVLLVALLGNLYFDYIRYQKTGVLPRISVLLPDWIPLPNLPNTFLSHKGNACDDKKRKKSTTDSAGRASICDDKNEKKRKKSMVSVAGK